ncbi:MAG: hypothetical protein H6810_10590 [Phycisphaeraceae bacterium]|nr:MAG: hypothetical protein H6810_10590 [Phycisphaeraceae bacterium]
MESPSKIFAAVLGLTAFAVAIVAGLMNGGDGRSILTRALTCMVVCYPVGLVLGAVARHAVDEHTSAYKRDHPPRPIPKFGSGAGAEEIIEVDVA